MSNKYKILLIEDDTNITMMVSAMLESSGYQVICASTCQMGIDLTKSHMPDLIILDLGLPDKDGLNLIEEIRKSSLVGIIVLSARTQENDKVKAFDLGANDYVTKPFGVQEFLARVRAALRNAKRTSDGEKIPGGEYVLRDLRIEYASRRVFIKDSEIKFTQTEYNILSLLSEYAGRMVTYSIIIKAIWGYPTDGSIKKLQVNMANIRKKLMSIPGETNYIVNELGVGYRMNQ